MVVFAFVFIVIGYTSMLQFYMGILNIYGKVYASTSITRILQ